MTDQSSAPAFVQFDGPLSWRPRNRREVTKLFGDPTRGGLYLKVPDPKWEDRCLVELHGEHAIFPRFAKWYWKHHVLVHPYMVEAFRRAEIVAPGYAQIEKGTWAYNFRHMRHSVKMPLSYHSYGICVDINPDDNKAASLKKKPRPWGPEWTRIWPAGVSMELVAAFKSCGFAWGGDWGAEYIDPMHFEWKGSTQVQV